MILQKLNATSELAHANDTNVLSVDKCIPVQSCQQQKMESVIKKINYRRVKACSLSLELNFLCHVLRQETK